VFSLTALLVAKIMVSVSDVWMSAKHWRYVPDRWV